MNFKEIAKRSETGPLTESKDFLMNAVAANAMRLSKEYNITWDGKTFINTDDDMADRCFQAGKELFINTGLYSMNSNRVVQFTEGEVDDPRGRPARRGRRADARRARPNLGYRRTERGPPDPAAR